MAERVQGFAALRRTFDLLLHSVPEEDQRAALTAGAEIIADEAKRLVPVRTGELRDSIMVGLTAPTLAAVRLRRGTVTVFVGPKSGGGYPDGFYGHLVEFGTIYMPAEPFMRPAYRNTRVQVREVIADKLWSNIKQAARG